MEARAKTLREATEGTVQRMFCNHLGNVLDEIQRFYDEREAMITARHAAQLDAAQAEIEMARAETKAVKAQMEALQRKHDEEEIVRLINDTLEDVLSGDIEDRLDWFEDEVENLRTDPDYHGTRSKAGLKSAIYRRYSEMSGNSIEQNKAGRGYERGGKARALLMDDYKVKILFLAMCSLCEH